MVVPSGTTPGLIAALPQDQVYYTVSMLPSRETQDFEGGTAGWPLKVQTLLEAVLVLSGQHELDTVLQRIVAGDRKSVV